MKKETLKKTWLTTIKITYYPVLYYSTTVLIIINSP